MTVRALTALERLVKSFRVDEDGVTVQAEGGRILIKRVRPADGGKMAASEWAAAAGINSGTKLGS